MQLAWVAELLRQGAPGVADELKGAQDDALAYMSFPAEHWSKLQSTNVLERLNREFGTRARLVGICPSEFSLLHFVTALFVQVDGGWQVDKRSLAGRSMSGGRAEQLLRPAPAT